VFTCSNGVTTVPWSGAAGCVIAFTAKPIPRNERSYCEEAECMCFYFQQLYARSPLPDDSEIRHASSYKYWGAPFEHV